MAEEKQTTTNLDKLIEEISDSLTDIATNDDRIKDFTVSYMVVDENTMVVFATKGFRVLASATCENIDEVHESGKSAKEIATTLIDDLLSNLEDGANKVGQMILETFMKTVVKALFLFFVMDIANFYISGNIDHGIVSIAFRLILFYYMIKSEFF